jgi:hypothetical protein
VNTAVDNPLLLSFKWRTHMLQQTMLQAATAVKQSRCHILQQAPAATAYKELQ